MLGWLAARSGFAAPARGIRTAAVLFVAVLTAAASQLSLPLPFTPIPLTVQPMVVLLGGAVLGARAGAVSQLLYLALGLAGLPVFAASPLLPQGAARLLGPTGGYLMAYPAAAFVAGWLAQRGLDRRYLTAVLAMLAGLAVIYASGTLWLAFVLSPSNPAQALAPAIRGGVFPFVLADTLKLLFAAGVMPLAWRLLAPRG
ncbi:MAG: BioY protein [Acidobacteria bacterium]|nr:BioY protein [Acidobacteriota bacterium]